MKEYVQQHGLPEGAFPPTVVPVIGQAITVRGAIVNGVVRIGTFHVENNSQVAAAARPTAGKQEAESEMAVLSALERRVMDMLLAGDDPLLEVLREQYRVANARDRMIGGAGFSVYLVPHPRPNGCKGAKER